MFKGRQLGDWSLLLLLIIIPLSLLLILALPNWIAEYINPEIITVIWVAFVLAVLYKLIGE